MLIANCKVQLKRSSRSFLSIARALAGQTADRTGRQEEERRSFLSFFFFTTAQFSKVSPSDLVRELVPRESKSRHFAALPLALIIYLSAKSELVSSAVPPGTTGVAVINSQPHTWTSRRYARKFPDVRLQSVRC